MKLNISRRDGLLAVALIGLMFLAVWLSAQQDADDNVPPALTSYSNEANGARALALWLQALDYPVRRIEGLSFRPHHDACLLFVLSPQQGFAPGEIELLDAWVIKGGVLVLATDRRWTSLLAHFELDVDSLSYQKIKEVEPAQPLLLDPPWTQAQVQTRTYLSTTRDDVVVHLTAQDKPVLLSFEHGAGRVFAAATAYPFTNAGLRDAGNARLVHNLVAAACASSDRTQVVFDEFHHGYQTAHTLTTWLNTTTQGRSLIYAALVVFVYLLIGGRRFGRPLPPPQTTARRAPVEHIQAMANLFRRGRKRTAILNHYHDRLKRELAHSYRLDPTLADADFVIQLGTYHPDLDQAALLKLLQETSQGRVSEGELIRLTKEVDDWINQP